jgi:hypothetical protein
MTFKKIIVRKTYSILYGAPSTMVLYLDSRKQVNVLDINKAGLFKLEELIDFKDGDIIQNGNKDGYNGYNFSYKQEFINCTVTID